MQRKTLPKANSLIRARVLSGFDSLVSRLGGDPEALLLNVGLSPAALENPEDCIDLAKVAHLLENTARTLELPDFGLRLARQKDITVLGVVALIAQYSATVGEALAGVGRHMPYHTPDASLLVVADPLRPDYRRICYQLNLDHNLPRRQAVELSYGILLGFLQLLTDETGADWYLQFCHSPGCNTEGYRSYLIEHVEFGQDRDALSIPQRLLDIPIDTKDNPVREAAERYLSNLVRRYPLDVTRQVETLVERQLASGGGNLQRVAEQLGLHPRTLQRRLAEQGSHFEDLVDQLRQQRARDLLRDTTLPLAEITSVLGYTEQSSLNRSCSRWFGMSPNSYRRQARV